MKIKQVNEDTGEEEEIEVSSQEEMDAKVKETEDKLKAEYETKAQEAADSIFKLSEEKKALEDKIGGVKEDHPNFKALKEALDKKDTDIKTLREDLDGDRKLRKDTFASGVIASAARGNKDLQDKIEFHLKNTVSSMKDGTEDEQKAKIHAAIKLAADTSSEMSLMDGGMQGSGGRGMGGSAFSSDRVEFSASEKSLGAKLGITAEDYKKYGSRVTKK